MRRTGRPCYRRTVPATQVLHLGGWDDQDGQPRAEQSVDDRAVGSFNTDLGDTCLEQPADQVLQAAQLKQSVNVRRSGQA